MRETALGGLGEAARLYGFFSVWQSGLLIHSCHSSVFSLYPEVSALINGFRHIVCWVLRQECWDRGSARSVSILSSPRTAVSSWLLASHGPCLSTSPFPPPLFTPICPPSDVLMRRSLRCFCVVYRILCWIITVQFVVSLRGIPHATMFLTSLPYFDSNAT